MPYININIPSGADPMFAYGAAEGHARQVRGAYKREAGDRLLYATEKAIGAGAQLYNEHQNRKAAARADAELDEAKSKGTVAYTDLLERRAATGDTSALSLLKEQNDRTAKAIDTGFKFVDILREERKMRQTAAKDQATQQATARRDAANRANTQADNARADAAQADRIARADRMEAERKAKRDMDRENTESMVSAWRSLGRSQGIQPGQPGYERQQSFLEAAVSYLRANKTPPAGFFKALPFLPQPDQSPGTGAERQLANVPPEVLLEWMTDTRPVKGADAEGNEVVREVQTSAGRAAEAEMYRRIETADEQSLRGLRAKFQQLAGDEEFEAAVEARLLAVTRPRIDSVASQLDEAAKIGDKAAYGRVMQSQGLTPEDIVSYRRWQAAGGMP